MLSVYVFPALKSTNTVITFDNFVVAHLIIVIAYLRFVIAETKKANIVSIVIR